jgi:hypothetical protein
MQSGKNIRVAPLWPLSAGTAEQKERQRGQADRARGHPAPMQVYHLTMQFSTGTVVGGKIVVEGVPLAEGSVVAVLSRGPEEPFALSPEDEDELLAAMAEIDKGEFVPADELLASLRKYG